MDIEASVECRFDVEQRVVDSPTRVAGVVDYSQKGCHTGLWTFSTRRTPATKSWKADLGDAGRA